ncbi:MAG: sigma-70 family RNA polymerase sigma factor, partial [Planctomycetota bacterium]
RFVTEHAPLIRARIRRKLRPGARRLFDSQDIMSTLYRRVDALAAEGNLRARSEGELIALLVRIADNALIDRTRALRSLDAAEGPDSDWAHRLRDRVAESAGEDAHSDVLTQAFDALENNEERSVLSLWLQGVSLQQIGIILGEPAGTTRWRWSRLRERLREHMGVAT